MTLRLTELRTTNDTPPIEVVDRYVLIVNRGVNELFADSEIRAAIRQLFDLSQSLSGIDRKQTFENDDGDLLEIEQQSEPGMICVRHGESQGNGGVRNRTAS